MPSVGLHGEGGITKRPDGRLQVSITMPNGRRAYRMIARDKDPKRQAKRAEDVRRELVRIREADLDPAGQTVADYLRSWLRSMTSATHARQRPNTIAAYRNAVELHIIPALGGYRLERLSERHIQAWIDGLRASPQSIAHYRAALRRALNVATRQRIIARNPAIAVDLPDVPRFHAAPLSAAEAHDLLSATAGDRLAALWRLAILTGLRSGELLGLSWDDVDLGGNDGQSNIHAETTHDATGRGDRADVLLRRLPDGHRTGEVAQPLSNVPTSRGPSITVRAQLQRQGGEWVRAEPKASRALERVAIDADTVAALAAHKLRQAAERQPDWPYWGLVFTTPRGYPIHRRDVLEAFRLACDRAGVKRRRFHDLRHSSATLMREVGITGEVRKARLGHSTDDMSERYAHASATQDRDAVERLAEAVR